MIRLRGWKGSPHETKVRSFAKWATSELEIEHEITVDATGRIFGFCEPPHRPGIDDLATDWTMTIATHGISARDLLDTFAHELGHFIQWRSGKKIDERGVEEFGRALVNRWLSEGD